MKLSFTPIAWEDYRWWQSTERKMLRRINTLIDATLRTPTSGIGKPEPLKHEPASVWSRRITQEHRLVYRFTADEVTILACRFHYDS